MQPSIIKSAMFNGLIMGVIFSINFLFSISKITALALLSYVLIAIIIVGIYKMVIRFRDVECAGVISFWKAFSYILLTFFFAAINSSVVKYIYFQYINPGYLEEMFQESMKLMEKMKFPMNDASIAQMESIMKPASFTLQYIWGNVFVGTLVALIMSGFVKKEKDVFSE
ncbi:MAG: DUF4199 domain-containing protein [Paludibacter sp.]